MCFTSGSFKNINSPSLSSAAPNQLLVNIPVAVMNSWDVCSNMGNGGGAGGDVTCREGA